MAYFERLSDTAFRATEHTGGAWVLQEQHIAPALGLLAHVVDRDHRARRADRLLLARLSYDILGTVPVDVVETSVQVLRGGRTIELVEAAMSYAGRDVVRLRAWLMATRDTQGYAGTGLSGIPSPDAVAEWSPSSVWPGGFIASVDLRRRQVEPGHGAFWVRPREVLLADEEVSATARAAGVLDIANGMTVRADPAQVLFPNLDLTAHLIREPVGEWIGFDTRVTFGDNGIGLTSSVLHDVSGPLGTSSQILTVRPR